VKYDYNIFGTRGPRKMTAIIPEMEAEKARAANQQLRGQPLAGTGSLLDRYSPCTLRPYQTVTDSRRRRIVSGDCAYCAQYSRLISTSVCMMVHYTSCHQENAFYFVLHGGLLCKP
jgi:hypothetical protein